MDENHHGTGWQSASGLGNTVVTPSGVERGLERCAGRLLIEKRHAVGVANDAGQFVVVILLLAFSERQLRMFRLVRRLFRSLAVGQTRLDHKGIAAVDRRLEVAARTLGASRTRIFFTITLPLILPGVITGALLSFARSLGEFGATITFVSSIPGETQTLPIAIYGATQVPGGDAQALRLSLIAVAMSLIALAASEWLTRRSRHESGYWG